MARDSRYGTYNRSRTEYPLTFLGAKVTRAEKNLKVKPQKMGKRRIVKGVLAVAATLIVLVVFLVPFFVSSERCRRMVLAKINGLVDGEADFAELSMSWWKGIKVTDVSFKDSAGQTLVEIKQIGTKPHYGSILMGSLSFGETVIDEPKVEINLKGRRAERGEGLRQKVREGGKHKAIALPIKRIDLVVNDGNLKVAGRPAETVEVAGINSRLAVTFPSECPAGQTKRLLANLETKAEFGFERAQYMGLNFGPTEVDIQIKGGLLRIGSFSSTVNNGQFNFAGEADFKQEPVLFRTARPIQIAKGIQITDETTRKLLAYLNPIFANAVNISGVVDFNCERLAIPLGKASQDDIEVVGTVSIDQLRLQASDLLGQILSLAGITVWGQDIVIEPTRFALQDGLLRYDDMQMVIGDNPVVFGGAIGLDKTLDMMVTLPFTTRGRTVRIGKETKGARITLPLKGTIDKPELDAGKLLEEQLKEQLRERLLEGLDELLKS